MQKGLENRIGVNRERCTSSMATTRMEMEITRGLIYSVSRVIEVTAWQSDDAYKVQD